MKKIALLIAFALIFGLECFAGSPFFPYKKDGSPYTKIELVELFSHDSLRTSRVALRIQQYCDKYGVKTKVTLENAIYCLQNAEEENVAWANGEFEIDEMNGNLFNSFFRTSYSNRSLKQQGAEPVLTLDITKVLGLETQYPKILLLCCFCGNTMGYKKATQLASNSFQTSTNTIIHDTITVVKYVEQGKASENSNVENGNGNSNQSNLNQQQNFAKGGGGPRYFYPYSYESLPTGRQNSSCGCGGEIRVKVTRVINKETGEVVSETKKLIKVSY